MVEQEARGLLLSHTQIPSRAFQVLILLMYAEELLLFLEQQPHPHQVQ